MADLEQNVQSTGTGTVYNQVKTELTGSTWPCRCWDPLCQWKPAWTTKGKMVESQQTTKKKLNCHHIVQIKPVSCNVADPDPGSGAFMTSGSGIRNRFFPDPGSRIPNPHFWKLSDNFLGKKFYNSLKIGPNFFLHNFMNTPLFCSCFWIRDPRSGMEKSRNRDPG